MTDLSQDYKERLGEIVYHLTGSTTLFGMAVGISFAIFAKEEITPPIIFFWVLCVIIAVFTYYNAKKYERKLGELFEEVRKDEADLRGKAD